MLIQSAFRHGDIEDILQELAKAAGGGAMLTGLLGMGKWGGLDIKRVYFGNWLRDYSQAMDVGALAKLSRQQIMLREFEVTEERLGVYLPVEHIDNPKGYADGKDARQIHPKLRPPVQDVELEVDTRTGMKNYIANENGNWDTSAGFVRRTMGACIDAGRRARGGGNTRDLYEAYRLLGTFMHTLEDLPAHSNWCELALVKMGHSQVFCHVGDSVRIQSPAGWVPPLVTGTFGSDDFIHSLLGEATDHISEASVSDLNKKMASARSAPGDATADHLRDLFTQIPGGAGGQMSRDMDQMRAVGQNSKPADQMSPQELYSTCFQILTWRDNLMKGIERTIEKIPGLGSLIERITDSINRFVFTTLEPYLKPILQAATGTLQTGSAAVINKEDQFAVFDQPAASDPTHSMLAKDHFNLVLNEPAGLVAQAIVKHTVQIVVKAWDDTSIPIEQAIAQVLPAFHHPMFADPRSPIQYQMMEALKKWFDGSDRNYVINALSKQSVRTGKNKRAGHVDNNAPQSFLPGPSQASHVPGYQQFQQYSHQAQNFAGQAQHCMGRREMDPSEMGGGGQAYVTGPSPQAQYGGAPQNTNMFPTPANPYANDYEQTMGHRPMPPDHGYTPGYQSGPPQMPEPGYGQYEQGGGFPGQQPGYDAGYGQPQYGQGPPPHQQYGQPPQQSFPGDSQYGQYQQRY